MRYIRPFLAILLAFVLLFSCGVEIFAAGNCFSFDSPAKDEEDSILKSIKHLGFDGRTSEKVDFVL